MSMQPINFRHGLTMLFLAGVLCELLFLYTDTLMWMKTAWFGYTPDRAGMFVPPLFLWMAYVRLKASSFPASGSPISGGVVIFFSLAAFMLARIIDIRFIQALSFIGVVFGLVVFFAGVRFSKKFVFPFVFLMLMIPSVSYLIESVAGAILRWAVLRGSYVVLKISGGAWQLHPAGLQHGPDFLQIGFSRSGFSSILFLLIVHFAVAEWAIKDETRKFFFMVHFPLYFIAAYIGFFTLAGWFMAFGNDAMGIAFTSAEGWIPLLCFLFLMMVVLLLARHSDGLKGHLKRR